MKHKRKGFTVVELITVMIILIVLGTIGFMSYGGYLVSIRDTNRISQITGINKALNSYGVRKALPLPDDYVTVEVAGGVIGYQGYAGKKVLDEINFEKGGKDPLDDNYYTYYLTKSKKHSQMMAFLESEQLASIGVNKTYAYTDYSNRIIYVFGKTLGILTENTTNTPIQEVSSIKSAKKLGLSSDINKYRSTFQKKDFIVDQGINLINLKQVSDLGGEGCSSVSGTIVCNTDTVSIIIKGGDLKGRRWSNGSYAKTCNDYRNPKKGFLYSGSIGNGIYYISPNPSNVLPFKVYCNMTYAGGGWTYATKFIGYGSLFNTTGVPSSSFKSIDISAGSSLLDLVSQSKISDVWPSKDSTKDILLKCITPNTSLINYTKPFIIKDYLYSDVAILENSQSSSLSSSPLSATWSGSTFTLGTTLGGNYYIKDIGGSKVWGFKNGNSIKLHKFGANINSPIYTSNFGLFTAISLDSSNYCITAIK